MRLETIHIMTRVQDISVKEKRRFFSLLRRNKDEVNEHWIFPAYGITVGELCVAQVLDGSDKELHESSHSRATARKRPRDPEDDPPHHAPDT